MRSSVEGRGVNVTLVAVLEVVGTGERRRRGASSFPLLTRLRPGPFTEVAG